MRPLSASLLLLALLVVSLAAKGVAFQRSDAFQWTWDLPGTEAFLAAKGFSVAVSSRDSSPVWVTGSKGACVVRIADVAPQGWFRSLVVSRGQGEQLRYAFAGKFYDDQPVVMTTIAEYRQRLLRYLGFYAPPPLVRAVIVSPACPAKTIGAEDASWLS